MFPAVAKIAANQVFEIGELVLLILEHLDELSLVRVQGVCQRFRDLIATTTRLQQRFGFQVAGQRVINPTIIDVTEVIEWSPFLEWFSMHGLIDENNCQRKGPLRDQPRSGGAKSDTIVCLLPHAYRAAQNSHSSHHRILLTTPPVSMVYLCVPTGEHDAGELLWLFNMNGVTFGDLLDMWVENTDFRGRSAPVSLLVPTSHNTEFALAWEEQKLQLTIRSQLIEKGLNDNVYVHICDNLGWTKQRRDLVREWYMSTSGENWFDTPMKEQVKIMRNFLQKHKAIVPRVADEWKNDAAWPALALKGPEDEDNAVQCPYEVEFAAGVVFNRLA